MSEVGEAKRTPLYDMHVAGDARMVDFAGWRMPLQYSGLIEEHRAVRTRAGLFDVSHMGEVRLRGPGAAAHLQYLTCNDVARLKVGRAHYNALTTPDGGFVDDLLIYRLGEHEFLVVTNAGNSPKDLAWIRDHATGFDVDVRDESEIWALIALQGPLAERILAGYVDAPIDRLRYYAFAEVPIEGKECIVSRTGYTGEDGFEIYAPATIAPRIWAALLEAGGREGLIPAGLGARDTLRLEAKMALYGQDIDETTTPLEADLGWIVKLDRDDFIGRDRLIRQSREGVDRKLVGFEVRDRAIARHGYPVYRGEQEIGRVTSGSYAPHLQKNIGLAYLPIACTEPGTEIEIGIRNRRAAAEVVPTPFYKRPR